MPMEEDEGAVSGSLKKRGQDQMEFEYSSAHAVRLQHRSGTFSRLDGIGSDREESNIVLL